ncbi:hypothetical protein CBL_10343 [Carabus blaptoides fortunei]
MLIAFTPPAMEMLKDLACVTLPLEYQDASCSSGKPQRVDFHHQTLSLDNPLVANRNKISQPAKIHITTKKRQIHVLFLCAVYDEVWTDCCLYVGSADLENSQLFLMFRPQTTGRNWKSSQSAWTLALDVAYVKYFTDSSLL